MAQRSLTAALLVAAALSGCKIVYEDENAVRPVPDGPDGDDARNAARLEETFESRLLPLIDERAYDVRGLRAALAEGLDAAGEGRANRGSGVGAAWTFAVADSGTVIAARLDTSARTADVDVDGDGSADLRLQLGPVIRGTALRDAAPFYNFDDFRDQIEFARLARALNDAIKPRLVIPEGELVGAEIAFAGVAPLKAADDPIVVTPVSLEVAP